MLPEKKIRGIYPPGVATTLSGNFIVDGRNWIPIEVTASEEDIKRIYEESTRKVISIKLKAPSIIESIDIPQRQWEVKSSSQIDLKHIVRFWGADKFTCDCLGYYWRRSCNHILSIQEIIKKEK